MEDHRYHRYQGSRYRRVSSTFRIFLPWFGGWIDEIRGIEKGLDSFLLCVKSCFAVFPLFYILSSFIRGIIYRALRIYSCI